jgi:hypothetical protein
MSGTEGFRDFPMTRDEWQAELKQRQSYERKYFDLLRTMEQIADTPYWQGTLITRLARKALERAGE